MSRTGNQESADITRKALNFQFQISLQLLEYHLSGLEEAEYHWRPAEQGLHISKISDNLVCRLARIRRLQYWSRQYSLVNMAYYVLVVNGT
ncbi:hypothetical protein [Paenibacillus albidus]|uniref:hypothetical protein n=1 Tax=Paenibacillus albidus TaxID=2041023 RepID=UPI001E4E7D40|nr:hypothetical protein [Paenibacillus albidus]